MRVKAIVLGAGMALVVGGEALAWGSSGHRVIGVAAMQALPAELPPFLHTPGAAVTVGEQSREPDRSRGAGKAHDSDRDPGHFVDANDAGQVAGVLPLDQLPATREDYETALRAAGRANSWGLGYLPYSIIEDWQQLAKDFAYWRADAAGARLSPDPAHRAWLDADRDRREAQILIDIGALSHFVGDGSMPLHATVHYDGWGPFPNPNGYTNDRVHSAWEGDYVRANVTLPAVRAAMSPFHDCACQIQMRVGAYLMEGVHQVVPFYELQKAGGFQPGVARGVDFTVARVAAGATELRDEIVLAWRASTDVKVGYKPELSIADIEAGKVDPYDSLYGVD